MAEHAPDEEDPRAMAGWTIRTAAGDEGPFTIYQVQQRLHAGRLAADDLAREGDGAFKRVAEYPAFARVLEQRTEAARAVVAPSDEVVVNGVRLKVGPDGKPVPPTAAEIAAMLRSGERPVDAARLRRRATLTVFVVAVLLGILALRVLRRPRLVPAVDGVDTVEPDDDAFAGTGE